jgi:nitroreductase
MNAHDIRIYVFMKEGVYLYDSPKHELSPVLAGDQRAALMMAHPPRPAAVPAAPPPGAPAAGATPPPPPAAVAAPPPPPPSNPPVQIILASDGERFTRGDPERKFEWGALDAGIVSQNISLFCAATGLKTRPKASMDKAKIKELLKLADTQTIFLNHPVGYAK